MSELDFKDGDWVSDDMCRETFQFSALRDRAIVSRLRIATLDEIRAATK